MFGIDLPPEQRMPFFETVWDITRQIPSGKVSTYGQIAGYIPCPPGVTPEDFTPNRARWVGYAMAACPADVPWQRVINSQGKISIREGAEKQRQLLLAEGIVFDQRERVNLAQFGWEGPSAVWLRDHGLIAPDEPTQPSLL